MARQNWTDETLTTAVKESLSLAEVCRALSVTVRGATYKELKKDIEKLHLDISHFDSFHFLKNRIGFIKSLTDEEVFCKNQTVSPSTVRRRAKLCIPYRCAMNCGTTESWNGQKISLQLDHIDGCSYNHEKENLRWLCPNCHSQTANWGAKGRRQPRPAEINPMWRNDPKPQRRKVERPNKEQLEKMLLEKNNWSLLRREFGVSDNAVRKWAKSYKLI